MTDLLARLRIEGEAKGAVAAANDAEKALDRVGKSAAAAGQTGGAGLDKIGQAAPKAAAGLKEAAAAAETFDVAAKAAANDAAGLKASATLMSGALAGAKQAALGFIGGIAGGLVPWAVTAGIGLATQALTAQQRALEAAKAEAKRFGETQVEVAQALRDADQALRDGEGALAGSKTSTDDLAESTRLLADHTFRLADARREATRAALEDSRTKLQTELNELQARQKAGLSFGEIYAQAFGGLSTDQIRAGRTAQVQVGVNADGSPMMAAGSLSSAIQQRQDQIAGLLGREMKLTFAPASAKESADGHDRVAQALGRRSAAADKAAQAERDAARAAADAQRQAEAEAKAENDRALKLGALHGRLNQDIADEKARAEAISGGAAAELEYQRAIFERQKIEQAGLELTGAQAEALKAKADAQWAAQGAAENAQLDARAEAEQKAVAQTYRDRLLEARVLERTRAIKKESTDLTWEEAEARARIIELQQRSAVEATAAVTALKEDLRNAFIDSGRLGFDDVADYAKRRLREAVYDALMAKPIDVLINAVVSNVSGLEGQILGQSGLGSGLSDLLGVGIGGTTIGGLAGSAGTGAVIASMLGIKGSGNTAVDVGASLGGALLGGSMAGTLGAGVYGAGTALGLGVGSSFGLGSLALSAAGPIGAIAGLVIAGLGGSLLKNEKRPYARTDIGVSNGQFVVGGSAAEDKGDTGETGKIADTVVAALNEAAKAFGLDLTKIADGVFSEVGYVSGKHTGALGAGYFGGAGGGYSTGAAVSGLEDPAQLATEVVKETLIRAIDAGAAQFTDAERRIIESAGDLDQAAAQIQAGRSIAKTIDDAMLQLTDPAAFERQKALDAVEDSYEALKTQAQQLVAAGLVSGDVLAKLDQLRDLQVTDALNRLGTAADSAAQKLSFGQSIDDQLLQILDPAAYAVKSVVSDIDALRQQAQALIAAGALSADYLGKLDQLQGLKIDQALANLSGSVQSTAAAFDQARPRLQSWLDGMTSATGAGLNPDAARQAAYASYERLLEQARGGDANALSAITGQADRLLQADQLATSSASERAKLRAKLQGDIEGLTHLSGSSADPSAISVTGQVNVANLSNLSDLYQDVASAQTKTLTTTLLQIDKSITTLQAALETSLAGLEEGLGAALSDGLGAMAGAVGGLVGEMTATRQQLQITNQQARGRA